MCLPCDSWCSFHVSILIFYASIIEIIMTSLKGIKEKCFLGENPTLLPTIDYDIVLIIFYWFYFQLDYASHDSYCVEFAPTTIDENIFAYVESNKISMLVDHEKNALGAGYIVEFIHNATENYYERGTYACRNCNNIKFPLYVLKFLKLCLCYLPMLVDYCSHKLFAHKIPMHRKWVRLKCASHILHDAPVMFQFLSFMWASLPSSWLAKKALKKSACWETTQHFYLLLLCVHMISLL